MNHLKIFEKFEEEEWWNEKSPFDGFKKYDKVFIIDGKGKGRIGYIEDIGPTSYGVRAGKYFICNNVRRLTDKEFEKYQKMNEQLDEWDPFGEEVKEFQNIKVGDFVKSKNNVDGGRIGFVRAYLDTGYIEIEYERSILVLPVEKISKYLEKLTPDEERKYRMSGSFPYWLNEQFEEEEPWWDEESPFDNLELRGGDIVFIINGPGKGETGMILDISNNLYGVRNKRMYYACNKINVRRATKEEEDNFKNETTNIKDLLW